MATLGFEEREQCVLGISNGRAKQEVFTLESE